MCHQQKVNNKLSQLEQKKMSGIQFRFQFHPIPNTPQTFLFWDFRIQGIPDGLGRERCFYPLRLALLFLPSDEGED